MQALEGVCVQGTCLEQDGSLGLWMSLVQAMGHTLAALAVGAH